MADEVKAVARFIRMSPFKVRRILDQIRGRSYQDALIILEFMPHAATEPIKKVLQSAVANAEHNFSLDRRDLVVSTAFADGGPVLKRFRAGDRGRARPVRKRTSHITVAVRSTSEAEE
ncbi:50S ribosomal protein L22 [Gloeobacter kilaueensis]|uniref:Large ribosomal subunit protein uL22 n=1 Tax=Gloeobacter kilaueensis (strain ATCC BAA-2537 / CCAP 1431/1 / ULC 316 / JS1) TaxID=1183438 RepID=U5QMS3_GLOK1|nr:50S ribosomal protein L22 [Gloeobacter kilaueensis]AGY58884.1 50S ribosomal protein L22 [Gloeobacter kilaueensis JS1]